MSDIITSKNLDDIIESNKKIRDDVIRLVNETKVRFNTSVVTSADRFAFKILKENNLIQMPVEDKYFGGAIIVKGNLRIPIINTAQPRVYQYFVAWHEIYHLFYDNNIQNETHEVKIDMEINERMADYFAANMILGNVYDYYYSLEDENFIDRIIKCMDVYKAPYKAVLIQLYEDALLKYNDSNLKKSILNNFDNQPENLIGKFEELGLDSELVKPSYLFDTGDLEKRIVKNIKGNPEVTYHEDNYKHFLNIKRTVKKLVEDLSYDNR
ncbi:ImmA/IrrE family metallo-endopeptidase [Tepidibacter thalassicus]|uniref:IrrE N-terminal-like domain-containing protein n=1 Tax=Tepidibacter thalassicus DSM 15285 TaxID=1123350 RepID=A0A1M5QGA3_9FIRM|nr:hypothetical protein [Tepidibacter thalassicus]SHH13205.1 hypothetical protein SAMN02744040_00936 [Tepidibacter thalassicus DSM 15285]